MKAYTIIFVDSGDSWGPPAAKQSHTGNGNQPQPPPPQKSGSKTDNSDERGRKKKRKSRWGSMIRTEVPGMPAAIPTHLTPEQQKAYISETLFYLAFLY